MFVARRRSGRALAIGLLSLTTALSACVPKGATTSGPCPPCQQAAQAPEDASPTDAREHVEFLAKNYQKREVQIPMRDGVKLHTVIYAPKAPGKHPFLMMRTPYSVGPYGADKMPTSLGPSRLLSREKGPYIFVYQDVRGRFMSEGEFVNMTPHRGAARARGDAKAIDESTDTYDTIAWLLENVPDHNGRVGQWGISYPGFYAAAGMIDAHPALKAVSPQAPIADWYFDDFHHHGAFWLPHAFNFLATFGRPRPKPTTSWGPRFSHNTPDGYSFFLELGSLANVETRHYKGEIAFWKDIVAHPDYDAFWQERNLLPHLKNVAPAVMTVGGWFDAEDLYGPLQIYRAIEKSQPGAFNVLVMGPWAHGAWAGGDGAKLGNISFGSKTSEHYRETIEAEFFRQALIEGKTPELPEASVFETGSNTWRSFPSWPPKGLEPHALYVGDHGILEIDVPPPPTPRGAKRLDLPGSRVDVDAFISDPFKPVPSTLDIDTGMPRPYMVDDQRHAARRPDVLVYTSAPLMSPVTLAGPMTAELWVSTTAQDADWIVKVVDVHPASAQDHEGMDRGVHMGEYAMLVRSEAIRGRYRDSYETPKPFVPNQVTLVKLPLQDVLHTFQPGHRIQVQIQSTWFPMIDRNPQKWVANIFAAEDTDFTPALHRVHHDEKHPSRLMVSILHDDDHP